MKYNLNIGDLMSVEAIEDDDDNFPSVALRNADGTVYYCRVTHFRRDDMVYHEQNELIAGDASPVHGGK